MAEEEAPLVEALPLDFLAEKKEEEREVNFQAKVKSKDNEEVAAVSEEKTSPEEGWQEKKVLSQESQPLPNKNSPPPPFFDLTDLSAYEEETVISPLTEEIKILEKEEAKTIPSPPKRERKKEGPLIALIVFLFLLILPFLVFLGRAKIGIDSLKQAYQAAGTANFADVGQKAIAAKNHLLFCQRFAQKTAPVFKLILGSEGEASLEKYLKLGVDLASFLKI